MILLAGHTGSAQDRTGCYQSADRACLEISVTVIRIPDTAPDMRTAAVRGDGMPLPFEVAHEGWRICADSAEEILSVLIDGYARQDDEQSRLHARVRVAVEAQATTQHLLNAGELFDHCTEEETQILLHNPDVPPVVGQWQCGVPLILVTCFYQPLGDLPQPAVMSPGQIWWIDPSTAQSLLESLNGVRWLDFRTEALMSQAARNPAYPDPPDESPTMYQWRSVRTVA